MSEPLAFVSVREVYPNIGNEAFAFKAWMEALREDDAMKIFEGTKRWAARWLDEGTAPAYIPTLSRFLRDRRYRTDPGPSKAKKTWSPPPVPTRRWTAQEAQEAILSKPIMVKPIEAVEAPRRLRPAAEILASRRS